MANRSSAIQRIASYIRQNRLQPGDRLPSERKLAATLGVSHAAVNRAILALVGKGTLQRDGYKLLVVNRDVPETAPLFLTLLTSNVTAQAAQETAKHIGCSLVMPPCREETLLRNALLECTPDQVQGVLIWQLRSRDLLEQVASKGIPIVVANGASPDFHHVTANLRDCAAMALEHLVKLGHREFAFIHLPAVSPHSSIRLRDIECYSSFCKEHGLNASAERIYGIASDALADIEDGWKEISQPKGQVTAVVVHNAGTALGLLRFAKRDGWNFPNQLSIVSLVDDQTAALSEPSITAIHDQAPAITRIGLFLLSDLARYPSHRDARIRQEIQITPRLVQRESSVPLQGKSIHKPDEAPREEQASSQDWSQARLWPTDLQKRLLEAQRLNNELFPQRPGRFSGFLPVDLAPMANRAISREHSWLGDEPLSHLSDGELRFHGVPFQIIDEKKNEGRAAVVLRSLKAHTSLGEALPLSVTFPIGERVLAVYILHAAGWTMAHAPIGEYVFSYSDGSEERVKVIPYSDFLPEASDAEKGSEESIIQDWHPSRARFRSRHALPCLVTLEGDPFRYERYLYAWQWINRRPATPLRSITLRTLAPDRRATMGVMAITLQQQ